MAVLTSLDTAYSITAKIAGTTIQISDESVVISQRAGTLEELRMPFERPIWNRLIAVSETFDSIGTGSVTKLYPSPKAVIPELGSEFGGGICMGRHPRMEGGILIVSLSDGEFADGDWETAGQLCRDHRGGGFEDWRRFDRLEGLHLWEIAGAPKTSIPGFRGTEKYAFADKPYWTDQEYEFNSGYAWAQTFGCGGAGDWSKSGKLRARAVRIHSI